MTRAVVRAETDVPAWREPGDTAEVRVVIGAPDGSDHLEQRVIRYAPGRSLPRRNPGRGDAYKPRGNWPQCLVSVLVPEGGTLLGGERRAVVPLAERAEERADEHRRFRVLVGSDTGCPNVTQFVGLVDPCRAPDHSHPYDEVGYILAGHGHAHVDGSTQPVGPGSCFHLPPETLHCIENVGPETMKILGVFHSSDSPAARSYEAPAGAGTPS